MTIFFEFSQIRANWLNSEPFENKKTADEK